MNIEDIISAKQCIQKVIPFFKGTTRKRPDIESYPVELKEKLDHVIRGMQEPVDPGEHDLIFHFDDLSTLITTFYKKIVEEISPLHEVRSGWTNNLSELQIYRYDLFDKLTTPFFHYTDTLERSYWGFYLKHRDFDDHGIFLSPKKYWPLKKMDAIHICLRTVLLEQNLEEVSLVKDHESLKDALKPLAVFYDLNVKSLQNKYEEAEDILKSSLNSSGRRSKQLAVVKEWLIRENYIEIANSIIL